MKNPFKRFGLKGFLLEEFAFGNLWANKVGINLLGFNQRHHSFVVNVFPLLQNSIFRYAAFNNKTGFYTSPVECLFAECRRPSEFVLSKHFQILLMPGQKS